MGEEKKCLFCGSARVHFFRNPSKGLRRAVGMAFHSLLVLCVIALFFYFERRLEAGCVLFASCVLLYEFMQGAYFNDFRVCEDCARIEAVR